MFQARDPQGSLWQPEFLVTSKKAKLMQRSWAEVRERLPYSLKEVYNQKRVHSALGYRSPDDYEECEAQRREESSRQTLLTICVQSQGCTSFRVLPANGLSPDSLDLPGSFANSRGEDGPSSSVCPKGWRSELMGGTAAATEVSRGFTNTRHEDCSIPVPTPGQCEWKHAGESRREASGSRRQVVEHNRHSIRRQRGRVGSHGGCGRAT